MEEILKNCGVFIYPLGLCSIVAVFIIIERLIAIRPSSVMPEEYSNGLISGQILNVKANQKSLFGRIIMFHNHYKPDADSMRTFTMLEILKLERGMYLLDIVVAAAPLIGLLGTVTGLLQAFSMEASNPEHLAEAVGLALATTMVGLIIAIPAIIGSSFLNRRIDMLSARINIGVETLIEISNNKAQKENKI